MGRLRRQLSYANVMATVAVFAALGGGAYAAATVTGDDVVDRSLTGKDIKKRSVALNRLKGRPTRGRRGRRGVPGAQGAEGRQGPPGPVDPSRFLSATGTTTLSVGPTEWVAAIGGIPLERTALEANRVEWSSPAAVGAQFLLLEPSLPIALAGRPTRVVAFTLCYSTTEPPPTFVLASGDYINIRLRFDFDAADDVHVGASSVELAPA